MVPSKWKQSQEGGEGLVHSQDDDDDDALTCG